jgi:4-diphosphocytidyl-2-C-methyl-D-erythritol kinase
VTLRVPCPAKLNLFLAVGPPDGSGYHPVRTVFQAIGLFDQLRISPSEEDEIVCSWEGLPEENTLTRTLRLVRELLPVPPLLIELEKGIPAQSGLGGGSSDAAGLLRAIREMLGSRLDEAFLFDVAAAVGKDAPFFLVGGRAKGEGYGEKVTPLEDPDPAWYVVAMPRDAVCPTAEAFRRLDARSYPFADFPADGGLYNDFERVAPCASLELVERLLAYGASGSLLTGSGSAVFGAFSDEGAARMALRRLQEDASTLSWLAPSLTREESLRVERA